MEPSAGVALYGGGSILLILLTSLIGLASSIFLALCVYFDAKRYDNPSAVMWGVLSGFFSIAAIVYLIVKSSQKKQAANCGRCGMYLAPDITYCPQCGNPRMMQSPEQTALYAKRSRLFLILWIVSMVVTAVVSAIFAVTMITSLFNDIGNINYIY